MTRIFLACTAICSVLAISQPATCCDGELPESVVDCYSAAYAERDIGVIEALYADDYVWIDVVPMRAQVWDRATAVESARNMFAHPGTSAISLTLEGPFEVMPEDAGETWRIEGIEMSLVIGFPGAAGPDTARGCATLYVRQVDEQPGSFEIYREVTFGDFDCSYWRQGARSD